MKKLRHFLGAFACLCIVCACNQEQPIKHGIIIFTPSIGAPRYKVTITGFGFGKSVDDVQVSFNGVAASVMSVEDSTIEVTVPENATTGLVGVSVRGGLVNSTEEFVVLPGTWVQKASLPVNFSGGPNRFYPLGFVLGDKLYAGAGKGDPGVRPKDWYVYEPASDKWTRKGDIPFPDGLIYAICFNIGDKGFMGIGRNGDGDYLNEFWEYTAANDTWTRKADFPGVGRYAAAGFSAAGKGYVGLGDTFPAVALDWWEYDPTSNQWSPRADNPGPGGQIFAVGFAINDKIYLGAGLSSDWWEYNPAANAWTKKSGLPTYSADVSSGGGFVIDGKGYIVGIYACWRYDPATNEWLQQSLYKYYGGLGLGATIANRGYYISAPLGEFWEFVPGSK